METKSSDIVTVKDLIDFLSSNFNTTDKLAFFDEGGAWCELVHVPKSFIGNIQRMFNYVHDKKNYELENPGCRTEDEEHMREVIKENYRLVDDGVLIY